MNAHDAAALLVEQGFLAKPFGPSGAVRAGTAGGGPVYPDSLFRREAALFGMARLEEGKRVLVLAAQGEPAGDFAGESGRGPGYVFKSCPLTAENAAALRAAFPWTAAVSLADRKTTIGCGDRLGRATPGHLRAVRKFQVSPVLAQQSIRELTLTGRTFHDVLNDASFLVFQCGYTEGYGADADHLKTLEHIAAALDCGMAMITLDLSEVMRADLAEADPRRIEQEFRRLPANVQARVLREYAGRTFELKTRAGRASVTLDPAAARLCAVMYTPARDFAHRVHALLVARRGAGRFDLEMSIDETTTPTLPAHHLFIVRELRERGVTVVSLAPRFIGEFQKGIDYVGDVEEFTRQFTAHAVIAQAHGDYKISIHSGSDKFSIFPVIGRLTGGRLHEKTAGTSWLEAVRLVAVRAPALYRRIHETALRRLPEAQKLYHITPDLGRIPALDRLTDAELPAMLDQDAPRQVLHVAYGFVLKDPGLKADLFAALDGGEEDYYAMLDRHFTRHLKGLGIPDR